MRLRFFNAAMATAVASLLTSEFQTTVNAVQLNNDHDLQHEGIEGVLALAQKGATSSPKKEKEKNSAPSESTAETPVSTTPKPDDKDPKKKGSSLVLMPQPKIEKRLTEHQETKQLLNIEGVQNLIKNMRMRMMIGYPENIRHEYLPSTRPLPKPKIPDPLSKKKEEKRKLPKGLQGDKKTFTVKVDVTPGESLDKKKKMNPSNNNSKISPGQPGQGFSQIGSSSQTDLESPMGMHLIKGQGDQMAQMRSLADPSRQDLSQSGMLDATPSLTTGMSGQEQIEQIPKVMNMIESIKVKDDANFQSSDQQNLVEVDS